MTSNTDPTTITYEYFRNSLTTDERVAIIRELQQQLTKLYNCERFKIFEMVRNNMQHENEHALPVMQRLIKFAEDCTREAI